MGDHTTDRGSERLFRDQKHLQKVGQDGEKTNSNPMSDLLYISFSFKRSFVRPFLFVWLQRSSTNSHFFFRSRKRHQSSVRRRLRRIFRSSVAEKGSMGCGRIFDATRRSDPVFGIYLSLDFFTPKAFRVKNLLREHSFFLSNPG